LVGDLEQLTAVEAGTPLRAFIAETGFAELTQVRRQKHAWQLNSADANSYCLASGNEPP
jgi:ATP-dependent exoDNAse (exonuclease V) alpha subunit